MTLDELEKEWQEKQEKEKPRLVSPTTDTRSVGPVRPLTQEELEYYMIYGLAGVVDPSIWD